MYAEMSLKAALLDSLNAATIESLGEANEHVKVKYSIEDNGVIYTKITAKDGSELPTLTHIFFDKIVEAILCAWQEFHIVDLYVMVGYKLAKGRVKNPEITYTQAVVHCARKGLGHEELLMVLEEMLYSGQPLLSSTN